MKAVYIVFVFVSIISPAMMRILHSHKDVIKTFDVCADNCSNDDVQVKERLSSWKFIDDSPDRCYVKCAWNKIGQKTADGKIDVDSVNEQFKEGGMEMPSDTLELADDSDEESQFKKTVKWVKKNRKVLYKVYHHDE